MPLQQLLQYTRIPSQQDTLRFNAHDVDTTIPKATALHLERNATTVMEQAISQPFAVGPEAPGTPETGTDKTHPAREG